MYFAPMRSDRFYRITHPVLHQLRSRGMVGVSGLMLAMCAVAARSADAQPRLTVAPRQPASGSLVRLTIDRLSGNADSAVSITGTMAGEAVHFRPVPGGQMLAI